jgi:hypothetical protein
VSIAFLLDADNLSSTADVEAVFEHLDGLGIPVSVRRAYGGIDKLANLKDVLRAHAVRAFVNQGKGTTDAALVVDAMDLLHHGELPDTVVIGSSDADFAPLVVRLREAGLRVTCIALRDKADDQALGLVYDEVVYLHDDAAPRRAAARTRGTARRAARAPAPAPAPPNPIQQVLEQFPGFLQGKVLPLNEVVKRLRADGLMGKTVGASSFFKKQAIPVELLPEKQPNQIRWAPDRR